MSREAHVRFCESVEVRVLRATRPPMESWFHTLKTELVNHRDYLTRVQAKADIFEYIEVFYNRSRRHSGLGYMTPAKYEMVKRAA